MNEIIETPGTETPGTETPGTETPGTETPGVETKEIIEVLEKININIEINIFTSSLIVGLLLAILFAKGFNSNAK